MTTLIWFWIVPVPSDWRRRKAGESRWNWSRVGGITWKNRGVCLKVNPHKPMWWPSSKIRIFSVTLSDSASATFPRWPRGHTDPPLCMRLRCLSLPPHGAGGLLLHPQPPLKCHLPREACPACGSPRHIFHFLHAHGSCVFLPGHTWIFAATGLFACLFLECPSPQPRGDLFQGRGCILVTAVAPVTSTAPGTQQTHRKFCWVNK